MKKVLLIAPLTEQYSGIRNYGVPPIGVHRLASFLNAHGQDVTVYDSNIHGDITPYIHKQKWDIIGISILNDTLALSLEMFIRLEKECPESLLISGNAEAICNYSDILDNCNCNIIILGEGEYPMLDICNDVPLHQIKGIIFRNRGVEITNDILWDYYKDMDFSKMGWDKYNKLNEQFFANDPNLKPSMVRLVTSSHCNFGCSFCSLTGLHEFSCGRKVKPAYLSGDQIDILLTRIKKQLPETTYVYFVEDSVIVNRSRVPDFCSALKKHPEFKYLVQTETNKIDRDILKQFSDSQIIHVTYGIENGSENVRRHMGKIQNSEKIENIIEWHKEFGIRCYYLIILFDPNSTIEDLIINCEILEKWLSKGISISVEPFMMPYRLSKVFSQDFEFDYKFNTLSNGRVLKHPYIIYPANPEVREIMEEFKKRIPIYFQKFEKESGHTHKSKDHTGFIHYCILKDLLTERKYI